MVSEFLSELSILLDSNESLLSSSSPNVHVD